MRRFCVAIGFVCLLWSGAVQAQGLLDAVLGKPAKGLNIQTPEKQYLSRLTKRLVEVKKLLEQQKKTEKARSLSLEQERKKLRLLMSVYQTPPKKLFLRNNAEVVLLRKQIAAMAERNSALVSRLISAGASYSENLRALRDVLQGQLKSNEKALSKWIEKVYIQPKDIIRLAQDSTRLVQRLEKSQKELRESQEELRKISAARERNQTALDEVRRNMVKLAPVPRAVPRIVPIRRLQPKPRVAPRPRVRRRRPTRRRRRRRRRRKAAPRKVSPPKTPPKPAGPTPAQLEKQAIQQALRRHNETLQEQQFAFYRKQSRWLNLRKRDETLDVEIAGLRIKLYKAIDALLKSATKELASKTRGGIWFFHALSFEPDLLVRAFHHTHTVYTEHPKLLKKSLMMRVNAFFAQSLSIKVLLGFFALFALLFGFGFLFVLRRRLAKNITSLGERVETGSITRQMWGLIRLGLESAHDGLPYLVVFSLLLLGLWVAGLPFSWFSVTLMFGLLLLAVRLSWTLADSLFAKEANARFLAALDDADAHQLRRVVKGFAITALCYVPFLLAIHQLDYPDGVKRWIDAIFFSFVLIGSLLLLLNKGAVLSLIPTTHVVGRTLILFTHRFYPLFFFTTLGIFGFYLWGYTNFAKYLAGGITFTVLLLSMAYGAYRLVWVFGLWVFGFTKGEGGLVKVEKRWARNVLRLIRALSGVGLALASISLLFEIWGIGVGSRTLLNIFNYPFVQVKDTQITLVSLSKLFFSVGAAFWLSGFLKRKAKEYVYPAIRLSPSNQHATNTVMGYVVIVVGALFGLQWMGVGIGVLAVFAGIVGIGVGFGIQNIASNFISGLIITFGKPIRAGDVIEVDGFMGEVKEISGRSTTIETFDLRIVLIPNSEILTKKVVNWSIGQPCVMAQMQVGVAYGSDVPLVLKTLREVGDAHPKVLQEPPPALRFGEFGDSSLNFSLWVALRDPLKRFEVISQLRIEVDKRFRELGIVIAFPQRDLHLSAPLEDALVHSLSGNALPAPSPNVPATPATTPPATATPASSNK